MVSNLFCLLSTSTILLNDASYLPLPFPSIATLHIHGSAVLTTLCFPNLFNRASYFRKHDAALCELMFSYKPSLLSLSEEEVPLLLQKDKPPACRLPSHPSASPLRPRPIPSFFSLLNLYFLPFAVSSFSCSILYHFEVTNKPINSFCYSPLSNALLLLQIATHYCPLP